MNKIFETSEIIETTTMNNGEVSEKTVTKNVTNNTNGNKSRIEIVKTMYRNTPPRVKFVGFSYMAATTCLYTAYNYVDGANALRKYRTTNEKNKIEYDSTQEWGAIKNGINYMSNFIDAIFFPLSAPAKILPAVILAFNPNPSNSINSITKLNNEK